MKKNWEIKKLGDVCSVSAGQGAPQGDSNYCTNGTPFIKAGNLEDLVNGFPEINIQNVSEDVAKKHRLKLYKAGSVVFAKSGMSCMKGYVYTLKNDCYVVSHLAILTPNAINSFFLKYLLEFYRPNSLVKDSAYPSISLEDIKTFPIPVPSLSEQERIVGELDCLSGVIEKKKQQLKELDALAQSIFYEMFGNPVENDRGWEVKKLGDVCSKLTDGSHNPPKGVDRSDFYMLSSQNVYNDKIDISTVRYLTKDDFERENRRTKVKEGDILLTIVGTIGRCALVKAPLKNITLQRSVAVLTPKEILNSIYFIYVLRLMNQVLEREARGVAQKGIYLNQLSNIIILVPPLSLQQEFAEKIESIDKQKELIRKSIEEVETLFNSRMDYYFG